MLLFMKKKQQKAFESPVHSRRRDSLPARKRQKFFAAFFQKDALAALAAPLNANR